MPPKVAELVLAAVVSGAVAAVPESLLARSQALAAVVDGDEGRVLAAVQRLQQLVGELGGQAGA